MSLGFVCIPTRPRTIALPLVRWAGLAGLLLAEIVFFGLRFDTAALEQEPALWARWLGHAHHLPHLAIAVAAGVFLLAGKRLLEELRRLSASDLSTSPTWPRWLIHFGSLALFYRTTCLLLESHEADSGWAAAWFVLGWAVLLSLALIALPAREWVRLSPRTGLPLLAGVLLGAAAWGASFFTEQLWSLLAHTTFGTVRILLALICPEIICRPEGFVIGTPRFLVHISPECSGYEGMGLIWVFLAASLWIFRTSFRFPQAWLLLPLGTAAIFLANCLRIAALVLIGTHVSAEVAVGGFHSQAGWLAFNGVALGIVFLARRLPWFSTTACRLSDGVNPAAPYLAPLLALVLSMMLTSALSIGFDSLYPLRVVAVTAALIWYRREYARPTWSWSWTAVGLGAGVFVLWLGLERFTTTTAVEAGLTPDWSPGWLAVWLLLRCVGSVITAPVAEELAFRCYLTRRLQSMDFEQVPPGKFTWISFLVSSVLFGLLHGRWLAGTLAGMAYALAYYRRGKGSDAIVAHAMTNALIAVYVLSTGSWSLWS